LFSLQQISYTTENGFAFSLLISNYSETVKNITCHIIVPLLVINGALAFTASLLMGIDEGGFLFRIQEIGIEYVI
jgi:hypothetical protein